jgi:hypothetical protein
VNQYDIELPIEPQRSHISFDVFALGIEPLAHHKHPGRTICQGQREVGLEMACETATSAPELEQGLPARGSGSSETIQQVRRLCNVFVWR